MGGGQLCITWFEKFWLSFRKSKFAFSLSVVCVSINNAVLENQEESSTRIPLHENYEYGD